MDNTANEASNASPFGSSLGPWSPPLYAVAAQLLFYVSVGMVRHDGVLDVGMACVGIVVAYLAGLGLGRLLRLDRRMASNLPVLAGVLVGVATGLL